jgi:hypothetical protein
MSSVPENHETDWLPVGHRRLSTAEIRELIIGSSVTYETVLLGNRPMVEKFHTNGRSLRFGPRAALPGRYEIKNDELCIHHQSGEAREHDCRRLFRDKDGQTFMWFMASGSKKLDPIIVKPLD